MNTILLTILVIWALERAAVWRMRQRLRTMPYKEYLDTPEWKSRSERMKRIAGNRCQVCNSPDNLNTHHRTYDRRGNEKMGEGGDLFVLCEECHELFSKNGRLYKGDPESPFSVSSHWSSSSKTW